MSVFLWKNFLSFSLLCRESAMMSVWVREICLMMRYNRSPFRSLAGTAAQTLVLLKYKIIIIT